jgi:hypothetical protein
MINNIYNHTINQIKATNDFKSRTLRNLQVQTTQTVTLQTKKKKRYSLKVWITIAASVLLVCCVGVFSVTEFNQSKSNSGASNSTVLPPNFAYNNKIYSIASDDTDTTTSILPNNYKYAGEILSDGGVNMTEIKNFQSSFGHIGDKIYVDPNNPYAAYLYTNLFAYNGHYWYLLFVTQDIQIEIVFYNGNIFKMSALISANNDKKPWKENDEFNYVGNIKSVVFDKLPSHEFETNIPNSLNCKVFASEYDKNTVYVDTMQGNAEYYVKLTKIKG